MKRVDRLEEKLAGLSSAALPERLRETAGVLEGLYGSSWREVDRGELGEKIQVRQERALAAGRLELSASITEEPGAAFDLGDVVVDDRLRQKILIGFDS